MDFNVGQELTDLRGLTSEIFEAEAAESRVREIELSAQRCDEKLWKILASTGVIGTVVSEDHGGAGFGIRALTVMLEEQGRWVAPVPLWSHGIAAILIDIYAPDKVAAEVIPHLINGSCVLGLALEEYAARPAQPETSAIKHADGTWRLSGLKALVPTAQSTDKILVSANAGDVPGLFLIETSSPGVTMYTSETTSRDIAADLHLHEVDAVRIGEAVPHLVEDALDLASAAIAALQIGVCKGALVHASTFLGQREQFGRPVGSFQAVQHQMADCWTDIESMQVTVWQAVYDLMHGNAHKSARVAKWWCARAGLDVVHRVQHVHGGIGVDVDYPVHRHFLWGKQLANTLGGDEDALEDLGLKLAREVTQ